LSLNENLSTCSAAFTVGTLGVGIKNVAEGSGTLGRKGVGSAVKRLLGGRRKNEIDNRRVATRKR